ncbi:MAG: hypothetical protein MK102_05005 [Fuerstiella sp.]|nr:hypothetical protein [Fuerstiella sp.]
MRIYVPIAVYVVAFVLGHATTQAGNDRHWVTVITPVSSTAVAVSDSCEPTLAVFNGFETWRATPDLGSPGSGGFGFQHFAFPMHHYTTWYRPRAATLTECRRCEKDTFCPRGFGHLFADSCDGFRMEYSPYVLCADQSLYGPSYIVRQADQRCDHSVE